MEVRTIAVLVVLLLAACGGMADAPAPTNGNAPAAKPAPAPVIEPPAAYPIAVVANAACALDGLLYVTGGYGHRDANGNAEFVNRAYSYDPAQNQWQRLPDMPVPRCFHAGVAAEGKVWLFGGLCCAGAEASAAQVDCYDPETGKWTTPFNLPTPRNRLAACATGSRVYVTGGMDINGDSAVVDVLDASTGKWSVGPALPKPMHGHSLAAVGEELVAIGGSGKPEGTWILEGNTWREAANSPGALLFAAAVMHNRFVFLLGNRVQGDIPLLCYDVTADRWEKVADKSVRTHRTAAVNLLGKIYVVAGEDPEGGELALVSVYDPESGEWRHSE